MNYRYVFIDGGNYVERIPTPVPGTSYEVQRQLKAKWNATSLVLLRPDGPGWNNWLDRIPLEERITE